MICSNCQTENRPGRKFCLRCGSALATICPTCGAANEPDAGFCGECGTRLGNPAATSTTAAAERPPAGDSADASARAPTSERRLVTVLFADLVGYTSLAEGLDAEDTRDLLDRYFAASREIVQRYGGVVEKFIGDAVMAVWGTPTAHGDDAERAVRAALDLAVAIPALAGGQAWSGLQLRAGVLTGEAAVNLAADGQAMVAGDLVNTASRLQSVAGPGTVLVGEATMRSASSAISFEPAGEQQLKGREAPVAAWRAVSVVGKVGGAGRADLVEPPFVGRDAEFSAIKERLHATTRDGRLRLVSVTGVAGIGKSRLAWELEKYLDGLVETVYWHQGRSLAYGEGIAFWALGEMVRRRAGISEGDDAATTADKLAASVAEFAADADEARWILPRLRALLGLEDATGDRRDELFAAWRRFFERIAARDTAVLVFEDLQWADDGLIAFIDSLMEWSRGFPIVVVTLARPELFERHPTWGAGQRDFTALHLEPLPDAAMTKVVAGMAPGLPAAVVSTIVRRAEGVPLYAVELFRMLVDRGRLRRTESGHVLVDDGQLDLPESMQSLIAARLDALPPLERRALQDAAVLGQTFTKASLAVVTGESAEALEPTLRSLVRRELLAVDDDPRSPERGQYGFVGALIREVAYGTLARRDRRSRHLAAARYFEALGDDELAGVLASHYVAAHEASQPGPEADAVAAQARIALRGAAERALAVASPEAAVTYLRRALDVTTEPAEVARLHEDIARTALRAADWTLAGAEARIAIQAYQVLGDARGVARSSSILGNILFHEGQIEASVEMLEAALRGLGDSDPVLVVEMYRQLGRAEMFRARPEQALPWIESGLAAAAKLDDLESIGDLLITRAWAVGVLGRLRESVAENRGALEFARAHGLTAVQLRAGNNLGTFLADDDPSEGIRVLDEAAALADRVGDRDSLQKLAFVALLKMEAGDWTGAEGLLARWLRDDAPNLDYLPLSAVRTTMLAWSGRHDDAVAQLQRMRDRVEGSEGAQDAFALLHAELWAALAAANDQAAVAAAAALDSADRSLGGTGWFGVALGGLLGARQSDLAQVRIAIDRLAGMRPQFAPTVAWRRALEGALLAREGHAREATVAYRDGLERLRRIGMLHHALLFDLDVAATVPAGDALSREAVDEIRAFSAKCGAVIFERQLEDRLARAAGRPLRGSTAEEPQGTRAPQKSLTTS